MEDLTMTAESDSSHFICTSCQCRTLKTGRRNQTSKARRDFQWRKRQETVECAVCMYCSETYCPDCREVMEAVMDMWEVIERCGSMLVLSDKMVAMLKCMICVRPDAVLEVLLELEQKADWERELRKQARWNRSKRERKGDNVYAHTMRLSKWAENRLVQLCGEEEVTRADATMIASVAIDSTFIYGKEACHSSSPQPAKTPHFERSASAVGFSSVQHACKTYMQESHDTAGGTGRKQFLLRSSTDESSFDMSMLLTGSTSSQFTVEGNLYADMGLKSGLQKDYFKTSTFFESRSCGTDPEDHEILKEVAQGKRDNKTLMRSFGAKAAKQKTYGSWDAVRWGDHTINAAPSAAHIHANKVEMGVQVEFGRDTLAGVQAKAHQEDKNDALLRKELGEQSTDPKRLSEQDLYNHSIEDAARASRKEERGALYARKMQEQVRQAKELLVRAITLKHSTHDALIGGNTHRNLARKKAEVLSELTKVRDLHRWRKKLAKVSLEDDSGSEVDFERSVLH